MQKYKSFVLPAAIVLGLVGHSIWGKLLPVVPYLIFAILVLAFSSIELRKLRPSRMDAYLAAFQTVVSIALYYLGAKTFGSEITGQAMMMGVLCPVASSVTVVASMLGADRRLTISYTIVGNLLISLIGPVYISLTEAHTQAGIFDAMCAIFGRIAPVIALPFFVVLAMQRFTPRIAAFTARYNGLSFYLWALALLLTLGNTIHFMFTDGADHILLIVVLASLSVIICVIQFAVGRMIGKRLGDTIAGGQCLGQKNVAMGIWITNTYLNPLASVLPACYSIWQNIWNSIQLYRHASQCQHSQQS